ncbi:MAG: hypothetical protein Q4E77_08365 [Conchiformibius sp.]|nr:hypothetical protein [Conchiformibius sp.]
MQNQPIQTPALPLISINQEALSQGIDALERLGFYASMVNDLADAMAFVIGNTTNHAEQVKVLSGLSSVLQHLSSEAAELDGLMQAAELKQSILPANSHA